MGQSAALVQETSAAPSDVPVESYDAATKNPFDALGFEFRAERRGQALVHKEIRRDAQHQIVTELAAEVVFVIGSGTQGRSYVVNRDGYLFQSPISWFTDSHNWGLSPGFVEGALHFHRALTVQCVFCHVNHMAPVVHTSQRYAPALPRQLTIGCERCHGPGQLHVEQRKAGSPVEGADDTIVNPARLEHGLREAVCQQCHLLGEERVERRGRSPFDYRPGLPLFEFFSTFVRPPEWAETRKLSQVEQMYLSRCFRETAGQNKLGCISCHDPHQLPSAQERVAFYRQRCLACHEVLDTGEVVSGNGETGRALARRKPGDKGRPDTPDRVAFDRSSLTTHHSPNDNCIACHMPRRSGNSLGHAALTDHRVVRRAEQEAQIASQKRPGPVPAEAQLRYFYGELNDPNGAEALRDLGIALVNKAYTQGRTEARRGICAQALNLLDTAVERDPDDIDALEAKILALWACAQPRAALAVAETILAKIPEREISRQAAAHLATQLGEDAMAMTHWQRFLATNPWDATAHYLLAKLRAQHRNWPGAIEEAKFALSLDPSHVSARKLLVDGYIHDGETERARQEFALVERLQPLRPQAPGDRTRDQKR
jgi:hypothetical protein